jgi:hypothetical protein
MKGRADVSLQLILYLFLGKLGQVPFPFDLLWL